MARDDDLEPRLGRLRGRGGVRSPFLRDVERAVARGGGRKRGGKRGFHGSRIGRGAGVGRVLASRDRYSALRARRVVIKTRLIKLAGKGVKGAKAHLRYLQRDGVTREGLPGDLYDRTEERADGAAFLARAEGDRHQFRFIVSAEDAIEHPDLKGLTRRLMGQIEADLGTRLDWVAVDHYNTGHPHTHVVLRGKDDRGKDLVIAREYLSHGMRERAAELVTLDLGPRSDREIEGRLHAEMEQERFTSLDRSLLREAGEDRILHSGTERDAFRQTLRAGRLQKLKRLGLAEEVAPSRWRLAEDLEPVLRRMGERGDIIKTLHREITQAGLARGAADLAVYDPAAERAGPLVGRVVARGLSDELNDRHYLVVDGVDGRAHYVEIGKAEATEPTPAGSVVAIAPRQARARAVDHTIAAVASANDGRYDIERHLRHDPAATSDFAESHVRRLEAMRWAGIGLERELDGSWVIAPDHLERAAAYERLQARMAPVRVEVLATLPLERQVGAEGATWLDRALLAGTPAAARDAGFGREVNEALARRRQWLVEQDLAQETQDRVVYRANLLALLRRRELARVGTKLAGERGLSYAEARPGERVEGIYHRRLDLASGRFAVIESSRKLTLVPWRPVLERNLGRQVSGIARGDTISWTLGRHRSGPSIS